MEATADGDDGAWCALENEYDAIVLDVNLPGMDGFEVLERLRAKGWRTPVLMFTARGGAAGTPARCLRIWHPFRHPSPEQK